MARITLSDVAHSYRAKPSKPSDYALQPLNLVWEDGGAYALLGPSGSGKTTLLSILSGLLTPSQGRLLFDDRDVTALSPRERNIAQVFQFPVIYDTMTVFENLAFPLRNRRVAPHTIAGRVEKVAAILDLTRDLGKRAVGLTADAKQRISMGRGLVREDVAAILFDEPLTVIDPALKWQLRRQLKQIQRELKVTLIYVTHDQTEALTFADHVLVMELGAVLQQGSPQELFEEPDHVFVAHFIGSPGMNLLPCTLESGSAMVGGQRIRLSHGFAERAVPGKLTFGIRPEFVEMTDPGGAAPLHIVVESVEPLGSHQVINGRLGGERFIVKAAPDLAVPTDHDLTVWLPENRVKIYADGRLVAA
jgi:glycerol transport system ATP-binding protein